MEIEEVIKGNCLEVMKDIPDGSIDMVLCDLPYQITAQKWDKILPLNKLWEQYEKIIKDSGAIILTAIQPFTSKLVMSNYNKFRHCWVWNKTRPSNFPLAKKQPMRYHEDILVFSKKQVNYYPQMVKGSKVRKKGKNEGSNIYKSNYLQDEEYLKKEYKDFYPSTIQKFSNHNGNNIHPTQKPVSLFEYLIKTYTNENDLVLDNAAGSMTTAIAALNTNRNYICIEKEDEYYQKGLERIKKHKEEMKNE